MKNRFLIYNVESNPLVTGIGKYLRIFSDGSCACSDKDRDEMYGLIKDLIAFGEEYGFYGNLWQALVTFFLLTDENPYTLTIERGGTKDTPGSYELAIHDINVLMDLYNSDLSCFSKILGHEVSNLCNYKKTHSGGVFNENIRDIMMSIAVALQGAKSANEFLDILNNAYHKYGIGKVGLHKAFRISPEGGLTPINRIANVHFDDLIGLDNQKHELIRNTQAFLNSKPANNCLLYGDSGTGKSSCIKALANEFFDEGLRIVEVYKHELRLLNDVIAQIKGRNYKFILYMDDLSFEEFETEYKYLKILIEGGLEKKPDNILIYATSNRRHMVKETFSDREDDVYSQDSMQEKLALFGRFGVTIHFMAPDKDEFNNIVLCMKDRYKIKMPDEEILQLANEWAVSHGHRTGRSAEQLMDYICGK